MGRLVGRPVVALIQINLVRIPHTTKLRLTIDLLRDYAASPSLFNL
jgi:hypothetical protein